MISLQLGKCVVGMCSWRREGNLLVSLRLRRFPEPSNCGTGHLFVEAVYSMEFISSNWTAKSDRRVLVLNCGRIFVNSARLSTPSASSGTSVNSAYIQGPYKEGVKLAHTWGTLYTAVL